MFTGSNVNLLKEYLFTNKSKWLHGLCFGSIAEWRFREKLYRSNSF